MENDDIIEEYLSEPGDTPSNGNIHQAIHLSGMFENWFLDYASYVILERAVPDILDGLKPVQRRLLHSMKELDDGRFNKVANIIGHTMKYHPHGDVSIGDALVQLGQKELLIDTQGNWGNILTGDSAAAPRYIEARLSKFAHEVVFNPKTTSWKRSYDGRNLEPVALPVKFPLLLLLGSEGIAVGLASKIFPHNFIELLDASILYLQEKDFDLYPDFPTGGMADFSKYHEGLRGGRIKIRAKIKEIDSKTLVITEIPFGTTTSGLIESILTANEKGKIKIRKIDDNTAESVEIMIYLMPGIHPGQAIDALYAFTDCESTASPNTCVIRDGRPVFIGVKEILKFSVDNTVRLIKKELEIRKAELQEQWHFNTLEKIFIEKRIYHEIEECESWESVIETIDICLDPYKKLFIREITKDDIAKLTEIKIKRISKYNAFKADETIRDIESEIEETENHLQHLVDYVINYYRQIRKKFGPGRERKTEIRNFDSIEAVKVVAASQKLYVNYEEGFAGTSLKKDEFLADCSELDEFIVFRRDGSFIIFKVAEKTFIGKEILHIDIFRKSDDLTVYNAIYQDGSGGKIMAKRFKVKGVMRDKEYQLTRGTKNSQVLYFSVNPNGEAEKVKIRLKPKPRLKHTVIDFDFNSISIKGRDSIGNMITRHQVKKIEQSEAGISLTRRRDLWFDHSVMRLNNEERGEFLGSFGDTELIITIYQSGYLKIINTDISNHFDENLLTIRKYSNNEVFTCVYFDNIKKLHFIKRFRVDFNPVPYKKYSILNEEEGSLIEIISTDLFPRINVVFDSKGLKKPLDNMELNLAGLIGIMGIKAKGRRLVNKPVKNLELMEPLPIPEDLAVEESEPIREIPETFLAGEEIELSPEPGNSGNNKTGTPLPEEGTIEDGDQKEKDKPQDGGPQQMELEF